MMTMKLQELLEALPACEVTGDGAATSVTSVTDDSRQVKPDALFVAVRGATVDGHRFIPQALAAGAGAIVGERPAAEVAPAGTTYVRVPNGREALGWLHAAWHGYPSDHLTLIGVTGTDGKTTTTNLTHAILTAGGKDAGMVSTVNARIGAEALDTGLHTTTPLAEEIQSLLARMVAHGSTHAVLETTSHGLDQRRVAGCEFDIAVVTNVTHEHLNDHGSWDAYLAAKARLIRGLMAQRRKRNAADKIAILNADDAATQRLLDVAREVGVPRVLLYSTTPDGDADVRARDVRTTAQGLAFVIESPWGSVPVASPLIGTFNVSNILAAAAAALALGVEGGAVAAGVSRVTGVPGRMEVIDAGQSFLAIVDFAHTPNALRRALEAARDMVPGRVIVIFGSAGLRDHDKRWMMGRVAGELADFTVVTAEDPRTESLQALMTATQQGLEEMGRTAGTDFELVADRGQAILRAVQMARPGDLVMACGKGHEQSMCFGTTEYPWDDRTAMRLALSGQTLDTLPTSGGGRE